MKVLIGNSTFVPSSIEIDSSTATIQVDGTYDRVVITATHVRLNLAAYANNAAALADGLVAGDLYKDSVTNAVMVVV